MTVVELFDYTASVAVVAIAMLSAALLTARRPAERAPTLGLVIFFLIHVVMYAEPAAHLSGLTELWPHLIGIGWPASQLTGPSIYIYVRDMTATGPVKRAPSHWLLHVAPAIIALVIATPFYLFPGEVKLALFTGPNTLEFSDMPRVSALYLLYPLFLITSLAYLIASFRLLLRHLEKIRNLFSEIENKSLNWLRGALLFLAVVWVWALANAVLDVTGSAPAWMEAATSWMVVGWVALFGFFGVRQPAVFAGATVEAASAELSSPETKYARSALDEDRMARIGSKLDAAMRENKLYQDPSLSLRELAAAVAVSENYVSQTLNESIGRNFFDYVNSWRISEACDRLINEKAPVLEIAYDVGFNSKSTFNAAFKKHVGVTPSAYRKTRSPSGSETSERSHPDV